MKIYQQPPPQKNLFRYGAAASLVLLVYSLLTLIIVATTGGQPATVQETYAMLQENRLVGMLRLDILTTFLVPLYYLLFFVIYLALKKTDRSSAGFASLLVFAGVTLFLASPSVFSWVALSDKYAAAAAEPHRSQLLAAGEAILASDMWHGSASIVSGLLMQSGALLISVVMLGSKAFGKLTAWVGILTHGLDLLHIPLMIIMPLGGTITMAVAGTLYLLWFPLIAWRLFQIARNGVN